ncbi:MAG: disulfide bond formation protein DsbA [Paenibacillaceae bacterium ZCTH02-B3]|nr:MAG: disulfide bond formation protein DsbA [Paenibacillaceae bacterium ZCTH02-B3]
MRIDIYSDMVCPWCRIGKKNLETALAEWSKGAAEPLDVDFHAFLLDPTVPPEGLPFRESMTAKFGSSSMVDAMLRRVTEAGAAAGLTFRFERVARMPNTLLSHRITALLPDGRRGDWIDAVQTAYFEYGRDIGSLDTLLEIAKNLGFDPDDLRERLEDGEGTSEVEADLEAARAMGVTGVPFFVLNGRYALSGAYPPEGFLDAFRKIAERERARAQDGGRTDPPSGT